MGVGGTGLLKALLLGGTGGGTDGGTAASKAGAGCTGSAGAGSGPEHGGSGPEDFLALSLELSRRWWQSRVS